MKFQIFVFVLFFDINHGGPTKDPHKQVDVEVLEAPNKLENDKKLYRVIRLSNGLKALLVSTQENADELVGSVVYNKTEEFSKFHQKRSACNLGVNVGSLSDPRDVQGLAHFIGNFENFIFTTQLSLNSIDLIYI